jgi:hypothetical protein
MKEEEEFIGSLANRTQTDNDEEAESTDGKDSNLNELLAERSWFQADVIMGIRMLVCPLTGCH